MFTPFLEDCTNRTNLVEKDFQRMEKEYLEFLQMWDETEKTVPLHDAFSYVNDLVSDFRKCKEQVDLERGIEITKKKVAEGMKERAQKSADAKAKAKDEEEAKTFSLDNMTKGIRGGQLFKYVPFVGALKSRINYH